MSEVTESGVETAHDDPAVMADLMVGYGARGNATPPAGVPDEQSAQPGNTPANEVLVDAPSDGSQAVTPSVEAAPKDAAQLMAEQLAAFKEEVRALAVNGDPAAVRKLHGEIGDINRKLKQLESKPEPAAAPVNDELTAAMQGAERVAEDFQELGGPLVTALKAVAKANAAHQVTAGPTQDEINAQIDARARQLQEEVMQRQYNEAVVALKAEHPDFATVKDSPEFIAWVGAKPAELQGVIQNTENPLLASRYLSEFKDSQRVKQKKQDRLSSAVTPQGVAAPPAVSKLTPEEEVMLGYQKSAPRPLNRR